MAVDPGALDRFKAIVLGDDALQDELRRCLDRQAFVSRVLVRAAEHGCPLSEAEVEAALTAGFHRWMMRGIDR
jgi:hypothetical protein